MPESELPARTMQIKTKTIDSINSTNVHFTDCPENICPVFYHENKLTGGMISNSGDLYWFTEVE